MFLSVLTKNLNWESLTKNLVSFNFVITEKSDFLRGGGGHRLKVSSGREVGQFSDLRGEEVW